jgi:hypothetical protein
VAPQQQQAIIDVIDVDEADNNDKRHWQQDVNRIESDEDSNRDGSMRGNNKKRKANKEASVDHDDENNKNGQDESDDDAGYHDEENNKNDQEESDDDTGHHHGDGNNEDAGSDDDSHSDSDDVSRGIESPNNPTFDVAGNTGGQNPK